MCGWPRPRRPGEALGIHLRTLLHLPNRRLFDSFEARVKLAIEFRKHKPRLVIGLGDKTPMASPDHWQAMQITDAAVFYSRLTKWDDQFDNLAAAYYWAAAVLHVGAAARGLAESGRAGCRRYQQRAAAQAGGDSVLQDAVPAGEGTSVRAGGCGGSIFGRSAGVVAAELLISPRPVVMKDLMRSLFE